MAWQLQRHASSGGTSEVYEAKDPEGLRVALKLLKKSGLLSRGLFEKQAALLVRLKHPHVVPVLGFLSDSREIFGEDRGPCYWMEFVEGKDLLSASRPADTERILNWFDQAVETLGAVHAQGIVHGDLSPQNIRIDDRGRLKFLDFSILPGDAATADTATLPYMAPERISGRGGGHLLPCGDLFSLGTIFYEALAGTHPRALCRSLQDLIHRKPRPLAETAPRLGSHPVAARVIDRMIRADPAERFQTADSVREALQSGSVAAGREDLSDHSPLWMLGAEAEFAAVSEALAAIPEKSFAVAVHGPSGVGKTRFVREIVFEAALKGIRALEFLRLHRAGSEESARVLTALRSLPPRGTFLVLEWNDDELSGEGRRFCEAVLEDGLARDLRLKGLDPERTLALLKTALKDDDASEMRNAFFNGFEENPGRILKALGRLSAAGRIRRRSLAKGWREVLRTPPPPLPLEELKTRALAHAGELWDQGRAADALEVIESARDAVDDAAERSRLLRLKINILNKLGRYEAALAVCEEWFGLAAADEPMPLKTVKYWFITAWALHNLGRYGEATRRFERCLTEGEPYLDDREIASFVAEARSLAGVGALKRGDTEAAIAALEGALRLLPKDGAARAETCRNLARAYAKSGDQARSKDALEKAFALYEAAGREDGIFWTLIQSGNLHFEKRNFDAASADYERAEALARKQDSDLSLAIAWNNRGLLERERGRLAEALHLLHKARDTLRFLGNANDLADNLRELAIAEASVGRWTRAQAFLKELRDLVPSFGDAERTAREAGKTVSALREGTTSETAESLGALFENLPAELQVTFVDRGDYRRLFPETPRKEDFVETSTPPHPAIPAREILTTLARLNEELVAEEDVARVLARLMDAAMEIARAENGFLVLRSETQDGPLPGYRVAVARSAVQSAAKDELPSDLFTLSLSAVRRALQTGEPVVTDNAVLDPVFREAKSVHLHQLKSILALPVRGPDGALGVFYLDHRFEEGLFGDDVIGALKAFAGVAALALQKGRMIEELRKNNDDLSDRVRAQSLELNRARLVLKNEYSEIVGRSPKMLEVLSMVDRIADSRVPAWIFGESGTGKESIARALHFNGPRAKKPFVTENCGALPESLLESELFGHKKGAFTHATADRKGVLQYADGGTIFLDEIADMSAALQAKLLRFLQEGEIRPIGSLETIRVDVRVVSASNKDLSRLVAEGKFREDLYYRLNGVTVRLPPLRERMEDLGLLTEHFLQKIAHREKKRACRLATAAMNLFLNYAWPGNIRELQNTLETSVLFAENGVIGLKSLEFKPDLFAVSAARPAQAPGAATKPAAAGGMDPVLEETLRAIKDNGYHKGHASEALGISRRALYGRLQKFGLATDVKTLKGVIDRSFGS